MLKERGFSLIELLIVVAIILVIAAIAVPNLMRARAASNESAAASQLRTLNSAEASYNLAYPYIGYGSLAALGPSAGLPCTVTSANACLIDGFLATNYGGKGKAGYSFAVNLTSNNTSYVVSASPLVVGITGQSSFCSTEDGVVRKDSTGTPDSSQSACTPIPALGN